MKTNVLPPYAMILLSGVILANIISVWLILMTMAKNKGELYDQGPPWMAALSVIMVLLCWYDSILPPETSFWGSAGFAVFAIWGSWVDFRHLLEHQEKREKERKRSSTAR